MPGAIITITIGAVLVYSALKGIGILDVLSGTTTGDNLDPHGSSASSSSSGASGGGGGSGSGGGNTGGGFTSIIPPTKGGSVRWPSGGAKGFKGPQADLLLYLAGVAQNKFNLIITATTNGGHVANSYHYSGRAFDAAGLPGDMNAFDNFVGENYRAVIKELIHNPAGTSHSNVPNIKDGKVVNGATVYAAVWAGHTNHVHVAA